MSYQGKGFESPFEHDNARNIFSNELPKQFVWPNLFNSLLSHKNHILIGARGSGKTAIAKMLSHEYLSKCEDKRAINIIAKKRFFGVYVPMRLSWVGSLKNKVWHSEGARESHFQWRLNVACCASFISTAESVINQYIKDQASRFLVERDVSIALGKIWFSDASSESFLDLKDCLSSVEYEKLLAEERARVNRSNEPISTGLEFDVGLFEPLKRAIAVLRRYVEIPDDAIWALCLDEAEYLGIEYQRILNSHMRTYSDGICFKITTMPYKHYTLDTNTEVPLVRGDDFEYLYLDNLGVSKKGSDEQEHLRNFCEDLFSRRIKGSAWERAGVSLDYLLGTSYLLSDKSIDQDELISLIEKYANKSTIDRAHRLRKTSRFDNEIGRKLKGALLLRHEVRTTKGNENSTIYSGAEMLIRCCDGNPRRFIGLLNMIYRASNDGSGFLPVSPAKQDKILRLFSTNEFRRIVSEPGRGNEIHRIINSIGKYFRDSLHNRELSTDLTLTFVYGETGEIVWSVISEAVGLGLIRPITEKSEFDELPVRQGTFRLSYVLSPYFTLLPRRGKSVSLNTILSGNYESANSAEQLELL